MPEDRDSVTDTEQKEGRLVRQDSHDEDSLDLFASQLMEAKRKIIHSIMKDSMDSMDSKESDYEGMGVLSELILEHHLRKDLRENESRILRSLQPTEKPKSDSGMNM